MLMDTPLQKRYKILVIGESCLDVYSFLSQKKYYKETRLYDEDTPVLVVNRENKKPGMAANVKISLESLGCNVVFLTNDEPIIKNRLVDETNNRHIARIDSYDKVDPLKISFLEADDLIDYDAVVFSDYDKGLIDKEVTAKIVRNFQGPIFVDSKKRDLSQFENCFLKINELEFSLAKQFPENYEIIVTLGKSGARYNNVNYPPESVEVLDVCGAGDNFLVGLCVGYLETGEIPDAIHLGNYFASLSLGHVGNNSVNKEDLEVFYGR
jgi:bifunctional ADP-heptose synthase (sugar kinase/adenylyltransferase)